MFTEHSREWHSKYETAALHVSAAVNAAYLAARKELESRGFAMANDDRAEIFVAALMEYLTESSYLP
jgi:hypothetical protein